MSSELLNRMIGIGGIVAGLLFAILIIFFTRLIAKKHNGLDERYFYCITRAKAFSWNATTISLALAWILVVMLDGISLSFFIITAVFVIHCLSSIAANLYYSARN
ncbi:hypothetical protein MHI01_20690 [Paenibacillus sp. FSL M7-0656]|uniref:hypothetical protein n=1 Tax=Paenibacillus sp. FSL M7-0656 TaxID=2921534 RepID=UPI0030FCD15C